MKNSHTNFVPSIPWAVAPALAVLLGVMPASAQETLYTSSAEDGLRGWRNFSEVLEVDGSQAFVLEEGAIAESRELIDIDPDGVYEFTAMVRAESDTEVELFVGVVPIDVAEERILSENVWVQPRTETVLLEEAPTGATRLFIEDGKEWKTAPGHIVAFDVDPEGEFSDLPNRLLSAPGIESVEPFSHGWEVMLSAPLGESFAEGTHVRQHMKSATYNYFAEMAGIKPGHTEWTSLKDTIEGVSSTGSHSGKFWPGTRSIKLVFLTLQRKESEGVDLTNSGRVFVKDITFRKLN